MSAELERNSICELRVNIKFGLPGRGFSLFQFRFFLFLFLFSYLCLLKFLKAKQKISKIKLNSRTGKTRHLFCHLPREIENITRIINNNTQ